MTLHPQCCYCCGSAELLEAATERWHNEADARANQQIRAEKAEARAEALGRLLDQQQGRAVVAELDQNRDSDRLSTPTQTNATTSTSDPDKAEQPFDPDLMKNYPGPSNRDSAQPLDITPALIETFGSENPTSGKQP